MARTRSESSALGSAIMIQLTARQRTSSSGVSGALTTEQNVFGTISANENDDPLVQTVADQAQHGRRPVERDGEARVVLGKQHPAWFPAWV